MKRVEALDWDKTVGALGEFSGETSVTDRAIIANMSCLFCNIHGVCDGSYGHGMLAMAIH